MKNKGTVDQSHQFFDIFVNSDNMIFNCFNCNGIKSRIFLKKAMISDSFAFFE